MKNDCDWSDVILPFAVIFVTIVVFVLGKIEGRHYGVEEQQRLAIKAGVAHYVTDEQGYPKFEFIEKK